MNQLPTSFRFFGVHRIVLLEIGMQRAQHDHSDHGSQEKQDHQRIDDTKPMNLAFSSSSIHIHIPAVGPRYFRIFNPFDRIRPSDGVRFRLAKHTNVHRRRDEHCSAFAVVFRFSCIHSMIFNRFRGNLEVGNTIRLFFVRRVQSVFHR